uniref:Pancreatic trypsin inhibitor n=1 Tax=Rhipicephalus zambeziensis TaxID=60191 RepID=A0A224Y2C3_9ACAR
MKVLLRMAFLSTLLITMCSSDPFEGCLQHTPPASICLSITHPYGYDSNTKTCREMPSGRCGNICNKFSTLEDCKKKCSAL